MKAPVAALATVACLVSMGVSVATWRVLEDSADRDVGTQTRRAQLEALESLQRAVTALSQRVDTLPRAAAVQWDSRRNGIGEDAVREGAAANGSAGSVSYVDPNVGAGAGLARVEVPSRAPGAPAPPRMLIVDPTPEQQATFERLSRRLDDPAYLKTLNIEHLLDDAEFNTVPEPLQRLILNKAVELFNRGELDRETFLGELPRSD